MRARRYEIVARGQDFVIEVEWLDSSIEQLPGVFTSEESASDCLSSDGFIAWLRKKSTHTTERLS